jgi:hypothetical protein
LVSLLDFEAELGVEEHPQLGVGRQRRGTREGTTKRNACCGGTAMRRSEMDQYELWAGTPLVALPSAATVPPPPPPTNPLMPRPLWYQNSGATA